MEHAPPDPDLTTSGMTSPDKTQRSEIVWMSTQEAARRLGVTPRTLYRFVDEGSLAAYKMGRVFRLKQSDVDAFIEQARVRPGTLEHLYPERKATTGPSSMGD
ncbi:MAG: helix-turn-helix domain-containing protein [Actinomycetota bacterium]|nr:helix-turn-helix domain-containing protein [Actinomycetota bacterium]